MPKMIISMGEIGLHGSKIVCSIFEAVIKNLETFSICYKSLMSVALLQAPSAPSV